MSSITTIVESINSEIKTLHSANDAYNAAIETNSNKLVTLHKTLNELKLMYADDFPEDKDTIISDQKNQTLLTKLETKLAKISETLKPVVKPAGKVGKQSSDFIDDAIVAAIKVHGDNGGITAEDVVALLMKNFPKLKYRKNLLKVVGAKMGQAQRMGRIKKHQHNTPSGKNLWSVAQL